eukprot:scaffold262413_cov61-Attheya_sp.AAC.7
MLLGARLEEGVYVLRVLQLLRCGAVAVVNCFQPHVPTNPGGIGPLSDKRDVTDVAFFVRIEREACGVDNLLCADGIHQKLVGGCRGCNRIIKVTISIERVSRKEFWRRTNRWNDWRAIGFTRVTKEQC